MSTVRTIAKNIVALSVADVTANVIAFFFTIYIARYLGASGFGVLSFALAFAAMFRVLTDLGLNPLTIRELARDKTLTSKYLGNIIALKVCLVVVTFTMIAAVVNLLDYPQETVHAVYLVSLSVMVGAFNLIFYSVFQAHERMEFVSVGQILNSSLLLVISFLMIVRGWDVVDIALAYFLTSLGTLGFLCTVSVRKFPRPKLEEFIRFSKTALKSAWPFALVAFFSTIYYWTDSVMLSFMHGDREVGLYNAAYKLIIALQFIPNAYFYSVFPVMSRLSISSRDALKFTYTKSLKYMWLLALPLGVGTTILANEIIMMAFGAEYQQSAAALQILIWSLSLIFISGIMVQLLNSMNRPIVVSAITGVCAILNVAMNFALIPKFGLMGASIATTATEIVAVGVLFLYVVRLGYEVKVRGFASTLARSLIAVVGMGIFTISFKDASLLFVVPVSALVYFLILRLVGAVDSEDKSLVLQVIGRRRGAQVVTSAVEPVVDSEASGKASDGGIG